MAIPTLGHDLQVKVTDLKSVCLSFIKFYVKVFKVS